jgi:hypothetical protein
MTDEPKKLTRQEIRRLKPGDWVAWKTDWPISWPKDNWTTPDWKEGQLTEHPVRSAQYITVRLDGLPQKAPKNRLYKVLPVIGVEDMHTEYDYDS